nr:Spermidine-binding periplasmic protein SpuE [Pseudomonas syringae]
MVREYSAIERRSSSSKKATVFINYMLQPEVIAKTSNYSLYPNANKDAAPFVDKKLLDNNSIYLDKETISRLFPLESLPLKVERGSHASLG